MNVDDLNEVKGLVDWLTPARAAYISAVLSQPIDPRLAFLRLPELWPKEPHQVFGLHPHPVGWRIGLSGYALAWRRPPESTIDPVGTTVVEAGEFDPLDYSDESQVILEFVRPWLFFTAEHAIAMRFARDVDWLRVSPAAQYGAEITTDRSRYLLIYREDMPAEATFEVAAKIARGDTFGLPLYYPDPSLSKDDFEGQAERFMHRVGPGRLLGEVIGTTINGLVAVLR